ncbi:MAG: comFC [Phenylobacterium sp.]|nr:comFC [Phenylobacterium sp.]
MSAEDGLFPNLFKEGAALKPGPRVRGLWRGALDLIVPPQAIDGGAAQAGGLSAEAWSRIQFLDGPVCDGCGQPILLFTGVA